MKEVTQITIVSSNCRHYIASENTIASVIYIIYMTSLPI